MPAKKTCIYHIFIIWECGDDGELRQTVTLFPLGLGGSNPSTPTNVIHKRSNEDVYMEAFTSSDRAKREVKYA